LVLELTQQWAIIVSEVERKGVKRSNLKISEAKLPLISLSVYGFLRANQPEKHFQ
jgi:hypothetical protein